MQQTAHTGGSRHEERVPFEAQVELYGHDGELRLEAEGLNVSMGGIALRAAFTPPLGALLECRFRCPPEAELVRAQGEVTWVSESSSRAGCFGLRFLELDTKSATVLRRCLGPTAASEPDNDRLRSATLLIDGLGAAVEAELKLADETRVVLEQQLTFLQLGRGVEVQVLGRGKERGRIASVELRHSDFDVPTLVFGILLDDAPERASSPVHGAESVFGEPFDPTEIEDEESAAAYDELSERERLHVSGTVSVPRNVRRARSSEPELEAGWLVPVSPLERVRAALRALRERVRRVGHKLEPVLAEQARALELPDVKTRLLLHVARARGLALRYWKQRRARPVRRKAPLRMQRTTLPGVGPLETARPASSQRLRVTAIVLAVLGAGLGAYALAPRTGADRITLPEPVAAVAEAAPAATQEPAGEAKPAQVEDESSAAPSAPFGDVEVPNGRVFVLRMNGSVASFEGEAQELGFKVRVPGRRSLDRAAPLVDAHPAIARALILNRGGYSELTVDFKPGLKPRYRVVGKGDTLELTIERL